MAQSPSHKFGQIIGDILEEAARPLLQQFADQHGLYLDKKGRRPARSGTKVSWIDEFGNKHDLDYVLERGGTAGRIGTPVAFIETAWRRYTKHSRNKAQEIQGSILPLAATHRNAIPFIGVVLAGFFTDGASEQLRSLGFAIIHFPYGRVVDAFRLVGIDACFDEDTADIEVEHKVRAWESLPASDHTLVAQALIESDWSQVQCFMQALERSVTRQIAAVLVMPLHGVSSEWRSVAQAIQFVENYNEDGGLKPIVRYEIQVRYNNGDSIKAELGTKDGAIDFLRGYLPPLPYAK